MKHDALYFIEEPEQIALLTSSVRQEIIDSVAAVGRCSISDLANELGMPADALYYHVRKLLKGGLLIEAGTRPTKRREEALYRLPARAVRLRYDLKNSERTTEVCKLVAAMTRVAARDFETGTTLDTARPSGEQRNLWGARFKAWLTPDELAEVNQLLQRLQTLAEQPRRPDAHHLCTLTWVLTPAASQPVRRETPNGSDTS